MQYVEKNEFFFVTKHEKPRCKFLESNCNIRIIGILLNHGSSMVEPTAVPKETSS